MFKDTPSLSSLNDDENLKDILPVKSSSFPTDGFALRPPTELSKPSASSVNSRDNLFSDLFGLDGSELEISASENKWSTILHSDRKWRPMLMYRRQYSTSFTVTPRNFRMSTSALEFIDEQPRSDIKHLYVAVPSWLMWAVYRLDMAASNKSRKISATPVFDWESKALLQKNCRVCWRPIHTGDLDIKWRNPGLSFPSSETLIDDWNINCKDKDPIHSRALLKTGEGGWLRSCM